MKFTPGPWLREGSFVYALMHSGWRKGIEQFKNRFYFNVYCDHECPAGEAEAVAKLAVKSPEMYSLLKEFADTNVCQCLTEEDEVGNVPPNGYWGDQCKYCRAEKLLSEIES